jgi:predicted DNA-binding protein YlxM (UPF0122 family)
MKGINGHVEKMLKNHMNLKQKLRILEYELEGLQKALDPGVIEDKVFAHSDEERVFCSRSSDQTSDIVIEHVDKQRNAKYHVTKSLIHSIGIEVRRLEYYLALLPEEESTVIRRFYFDALSIGDIARTVFTPERTVQRRKTRGIEKLASFYGLLGKLGTLKSDVKSRARFISYAHEERFNDCLNQAGDKGNLNIELMLYLVSGCDELWQAGVETFFDFDSGKPINHVLPLSCQGEKLLRLALHFVKDFGRDGLVQTLNRYYASLEYVHLELAIEAVSMAVFLGIA